MTKIFHFFCCFLYALGTISIITFMMPAWSADDVSVNYLTSFHTGAADREGPDGWPSTANPLAPPIMGKDERLYGLAKSGVYSLPATPSHYTNNILFFDGVSVAYFGGMLVPSSDGERLYGSGASALSGGNPTVLAKGAVFKTEFDGTHQTLIESSVGNVEYPNGVIVLDEEENIYGLDRGPDLNGRIFKITNNDEFSILHEFGFGPDGQAQYPNGMILASNGWLYGLTAYQRGIPYMDDTPKDPNTKVGALYRIHPETQNSFEILHTFTLSQGEIPWYTKTNQALGRASVLAHLVEDEDGFIYGTTSIGTCLTRGTVSYDETVIVERDSPLCGYKYYLRSSTSDALLIRSPYPHYDGSINHGTVYRIDFNGNNFNILHEFNGDDGSQPRGYLAIAEDGFLYGTTLSGGKNKSDWWRYVQGESYPKFDYPFTYDGTLYRIRLPEIEINTDGEITNSGFEHLHSFKGGIEGDQDGKVPTGVALASNGRLYGTAQFGGRGGFVSPNGKLWANDQNGTVFEVDLTGHLPGASVTITATPGEIGNGEEAEITWTSNGAENCIASGGAESDGWTGNREVQGSIKVTPDPGVYYYTLTCDDALKGGLASNVIPLRVDAPAVASDGNKVEYGNGAGTLNTYVFSILGLLLFVRQQRLQSGSRK